MKKANLLRLLVLGLAAGLPACGASGGQVAGCVTLDGEPLANAEVAFHADGNGAEGRWPAVTAPDGSLQMRLPPSNGGRIPAGHYRIVVAKFVPKNGPTPKSADPLDPANDPQQLKAAGLLVNSLPGHYQDLAKTPLEVEVKTGTNNVSLTLSSK
jgi:hypothetical protein